MEAIKKIYRLDSTLAESLKEIIWRYVEKLRKEKGIDLVKIMNFCGTHEWTTVHYGLRSLMPQGLDLVAGPGCPVCITPSYYIETAIKLSMEGVRVYTFGDAYRLPALKPVKGAGSLVEAKALGGDVKTVYSFLDAIKDARKSGRTSIFLGIGFETTTPSYATPIAEGKVPENLLFLSVLRLTPPAAKYAIRIAIERNLPPVQGVIAPGHVSTITGAKPWHEFSLETGIPTVISGFEPIDLLLSVAKLLKMIMEKRVGVEVEYRRVVTWEGNKRAKRLIGEVFNVVDAAWRGIGFIPDSGLKLKDKYWRLDAVTQLGLREPSREEWSYDLPKDCKCAEITLGLAKPTDCPLYLKICTPDKPWGPCMVSLEGTCAVWARFGGGGLALDLGKELGLI